MYRFPFVFPPEWSSSSTDGPSSTTQSLKSINDGLRSIPEEDPEGDPCDAEGDSCGAIALNDEAVGDSGVSSKLGGEYFVYLIDSNSEILDCTVEAILKAHEEEQWANAGGVLSAANFHENIYRTSATPMNESEMWQRQKCATGQEEMMNALVQGIWAYVSQRLLNLHYDFPIG